MIGGTNPTDGASHRSRFDEFQRRLVQQAVGQSAEHLNRFYRYSPREFFHFSYDVLTEQDLPDEALKASVFAETISYTHGDTPEEFYRIHLFDHSILKAVSSRRNAPALYPFLLYILTHELIHISRLSRLGLENPSAEEREREEETVHRLTRDVLTPEGSFPLEQVADLYHLNLLPLIRDRVTGTEGPNPAHEGLSLFSRTSSAWWQSD